MRSSGLFVAAAVAALLVSSSASAGGRNPASFHRNPGIMFAFAVEGPHEEQVTPPPAKDAPPPAAPATAAWTRPVGQRGVTLDVATGVRVLAGESFDGAAINGVFIPFRFSLTGFITSRIGISAGVEAAPGTLTEGCGPETCKNAMHLSVPVSMQYAFIDHMKGPYVQAGVSLLPTYLASSREGADDEAFATITVSGLADAHFGGGYRVPLPGFDSSVLDIQLAGNVGQFNKLSYGRFDGDIPSSATAVHYSAHLTAGWHFGF